MAFNQEITDRCKAVGFYRHVEWNRKHGVLIKLYDRVREDLPQTVSFEAGTYDIDYDQTLPGYRQFALSRKDTVRFMLNVGFSLGEIAQMFRQIDGCQVVIKQIA